eukprot:Sdes_comp22229_c0_seq1m20726
MDDKNIETSLMDMVDFSAIGNSLEPSYPAPNFSSSQFDSSVEDIVGRQLKAAVMLGQAVVEGCSDLHFEETADFFLDSSYLEDTSVLHSRKRIADESLGSRKSAVRRRTASLPDLTHHGNLVKPHGSGVRIRSNSEPSLSFSQLPMRFRDLPASFWIAPDHKQPVSEPVEACEAEIKPSPMVPVGPADTELLFSLFDCVKKSLEIEPIQQVDMMIDFFLQSQCLGVSGSPHGIENRQPENFGSTSSLNFLEGNPIEFSCNSSSDSSPLDWLSSTGSLFPNNHHPSPQLITSDGDLVSALSELVTAF